MLVPTTAVVVCAYTLDRWDDLRLSLRSAAEQSVGPDELLLVVDHNDELLHRAESELRPELPALRVLPNSRKQGLSGARNTAVEHVSAEVVVFLDDDAAAADGWLAALVEHYQDPAVIAVGGVAGPRWPAGAARPVTLPAATVDGRGELDWVVGCTYTGQPQQAAEVRNLMGCNMSFRRAVFAQVGGFSEDLGRVGKTPLGCEETELCIRARGANPGSRIVFEPAAAVRHRVTDDRLTWRYLRRRCYAEGVSKAAVASMVGSDQALETERSYATRVLPRAVVRGLSAGSLAGLQAAAAVVLALTTTVLGYARARATGVSVVAEVPRLVLDPGAGRSPASGADHR